MNSLDSAGNGFTGRVDGPLFDARHILMPATLVFGTIGEALQTDAEHLVAAGREVPQSPGLVGWMFNALATNPLDSKALGLACATAASVEIVHAVRTARNINYENVLIGSGASRESAVEPVAKRALRRLGTTVMAGAVGFAAYKTGENFSPRTDFLSSTALIGASVTYLEVVKKRITGRW
jgi:hypothetical protein